MRIYPSECFATFNLGRCGLTPGCQRDPTEDDYPCHPESETNRRTTHDIADATAGYEKRSRLSDDHDATHPVVVGQAKESGKWQKM